MANKFASLKRSGPVDQAADQAALDAFVAGADTRSTVIAPAGAALPVKQKQLNVRISKERWLRLMNYCAQNDITFQQFVCDAIDRLA